MGLWDSIKGYLGGRGRSEPESAVAEATGGQVAAEIADGWTMREAEELARLDQEEREREEERDRTERACAERGEWDKVSSYTLAELVEETGAAYVRDEAARPLIGPKLAALVHELAERDPDAKEFFEEFGIEEGALDVNAAEVLADFQWRLYSYERERDEADRFGTGRMEMVKRGDWTRPEPEYERRESILRDDCGYWCEVEKSYAIIGGGDYDALYGPFGSAELAERFGGLAAYSAASDYPLEAVEAVRDVSRALADHPDDQGLRAELTTLIGATGQGEEAAGLAAGAGMDRNTMRGLADAGRFDELAERMEDVIDRVREAIEERENMVAELSPATPPSDIGLDLAREEAAGHDLGR